MQTAAARECGLIRVAHIRSYVRFLLIAKEAFLSGFLWWRYHFFFCIKCHSFLSTHFSEDVSICLSDRVLLIPTRGYLLLILGEVPFPWGHWKPCFCDQPAVRFTTRLWCWCVCSRERLESVSWPAGWGGRWDGRIPCLPHPPQGPPFPPGPPCALRVPLRAGSAWKSLTVKGLWELPVQNTKEERTEHWDAKIYEGERLP